MLETQLSLFDNDWYLPGRPQWVQALWFFLGLPVLRSALLPSSSIRVALLKLFGARLGTNLVIKPGVRVKYPWRLKAGDHCWFGEDCWIDNLSDVILGSNVCISQGAYLCTGNHDWSDPSFALITKPIVIEDGAWVGAKAVVCPGTYLGRCCLVTAGSVVSKMVPDFEIHSGNPARFLRKREYRAHGRAQQNEPYGYAKQSVASD